MSPDETLAGMPMEIRKEILWGRTGLTAGFFGPELIAEALCEVLRKMDLSTMEGFVRFDEAFRSHPFGLDNIVVEVAAGCLSLPHWSNPDGANLSLLGLGHVWGIGTFGAAYGLVCRSATEMPPTGEVGQWLPKPAWDEATRHIDSSRLEESGKMPMWQISHMRTKRVFLTQGGQMFVVEVEWEAVELAPKVYKPNRFQATKVTFRSSYGTWDQKDSLEFVTSHGLKAGMAVLSGLQLALQSSNHRLRETLKTNERAEAILVRLLAQTNG